MYVIRHAHLSGSACLDGLQDGELRLPVAGGPCGVSGFEVWMHTLAPGAQTAVLRHAGEMVSLALAGSGKLLVGGGPLRFQAPCTLIIPRDTDFQLVNNGTLALQAVLVFTHPPYPASPGADPAG